MKMNVESVVTVKVRLDEREIGTGAEQFFENPKPFFVSIRWSLVIGKAELFCLELHGIRHVQNISDVSFSLFNKMFDIHKRPLRFFCLFLLYTVCL